MKVVIAIDDSPYSEHVINSVTSRHWPENVQFKLVNVIEPLDAQCRQVIEQDNGMSLQEIERKRREASVNRCEKIRHSIEEAVQGSIVHFEVRNGRAATELLEAAVDWNADRILIGARGHSACPHNLPGSVSKAVAHQAGCHVEVVRAQSPESREPVSAV